MAELFFDDLQAGIRHLVDSAGLTLAEASRALGHNARYLSTMLTEGTTPRLDLLISIARTCGYAVELHGHGEVLVLADRELMGSQADAYPKAKVFVLSRTEFDNPVEPEPQPEESSPKRRRIDFASIPEETEEQFAERDPAAYEEYRREMLSLAEEAMDLQNRLDSLRGQFAIEVKHSLDVGQ